MEKAAKLTGRTIQAVIGLAVSWRCPKHGVRVVGWGGFRSEWQHDRTDQVGGGWGCGVNNTLGDTHKEGMRGQKGDGTAPVLCRTQQPAATWNKGGRGVILEAYIKLFLCHKRRAVGFISVFPYIQGFISEDLPGVISAQDLIQKKWCTEAPRRSVSKTISHIVFLSHSSWRKSNVIITGSGWSLFTFQRHTNTWSETCHRTGDQTD